MASATLFGVLAMDVARAESKMAVSRRARPLSSAAQYLYQHSWQSNRRSNRSNRTTGDVLLSWWSHSLDNNSAQIQMHRSCRVQSLTWRCSCDCQQLTAAPAALSHVTEGHTSDLMDGQSSRKEVGNGDVERRLSATGVTRLPGNDAMILSPRK